MFSCSSQKDKLVKHEIDVLLIKSESWQDVLIKNKNKNDKDTSDIVRSFYKNNCPGPQLYEKLIFIKNYFELSDAKIHRKEILVLLSKKSEHTIYFYANNRGENMYLDELYELEVSLFKHLTNIKELIAKK